uniref:Uncharacterized protein n=1 Tax=Aegilops tauschii subsp. strangulata TaxID=200361 RepID=A0A453GRM4_AEGTS
MHKKCRSFELTPVQNCDTYFGSERVVFYFAPFQVLRLLTIVRWISHTATFNLYMPEIRCI